ncbi:hypothetical protein C447_13152 [Halococcus hamelinensis 100A6]|uniref:Uncharacterized protein n=1 Tax=Halococcus hamelinensis 100A6 TaxID=1132509 RepID=M0LVI2_9EURY|nr:hypothetical protein C447_13152 [Halococcus hamelinensis 100A6]
MSTFQSVSMSGSLFRLPSVSDSASLFLLLSVSMLPFRSESAFRLVLGLALPSQSVSPLESASP